MSVGNFASSGRRRLSLARRLLLHLILVQSVATVAVANGIPARDEITESPLVWVSGTSTLALDASRAFAGSHCVGATNPSTSFEMMTLAALNSTWDFAGANVTAVGFSLQAFRYVSSNTFIPGSLTLQVFTPTGMAQISTIGDPGLSAWYVWAQVEIPLSGDESWTRTDFGTPDLSHVSGIKISGSTLLANTIVWIDDFTFTASAPPPPGFAANVHWSGPGGDIWNTNSSPYVVDASDPFAVLWSSPSTEGLFHRPSGIVLADVGESAIPYLFGSTGYYQNRPYRRTATTGAASAWTAQNGQNDSGTNFRVALSLDGSTVYHVDLGSRVRAYPTGNDPNGTPTWISPVEGSSLTDCIKVGPDGRIYGHFHDGDYGPTIRALDPQTGTTAWWNASYGLEALFPGAFLQHEGHFLYIVAGRYSVRAYDAAAPSESAPAWSYHDSQNSLSAPTVDPGTGSVYVFRGNRVIKLGPTGQLLWSSPAVGAGETGCSFGALSRDRQTYYFQTGTDANGGKLYAFRTSNGTIKWSFPTGARVRYDGGVGGPVVSANGLVFVPNGAHDVYPGDNRIYCVEDSAGVAPVLRGSFDLRNEGDVGGPWLSIGPGGVLYFDAWGMPNDPRVFACQANPSLLLPPAQQRAFALDSQVRVRWQPLASPGEGFAKYVIYRSLAPFTSVTGLEPVGEVTDAATGEFVDTTAANGATYWYAVTARGLTGGEIAEVTGVGPRTPRSEIDYQVVTVSRTPRFPRYQPEYTAYSQIDATGFGPYRFRAATGLGGGQTPSMPRWPSLGESVTYTGVARNRGTHEGTVTLAMTWSVDGATVATTQREVALAPGDTIRAEYSMAWDGLDHEVTFSFEADVTESREANNTLGITAKSVGFLTYIDETHAENFREESVDYPHAATDDIIDWLNYHMAHFNGPQLCKNSLRRSL